MTVEQKWNADHWKKASRRLLAKMISEFLYEEMIHAEKRMANIFCALTAEYPTGFLLKKG
ncbi:hypothetical protein MGI18_15800 [Bacillus sp. OVS6]|nr:hypothetical protein MGI18_15800 [Bacillus sp. OVS6]